jgi:hypothetical protein
VRVAGRDHPVTVWTVGRELPSRHAGRCHQG